MKKDFDPSRVGSVRASSPLGKKMTQQNKKKKAAKEKRKERQMYPVIRENKSKDLIEIGEITRAELVRPNRVLKPEVKNKELTGFSIKKFLFGNTDK